MLSCLMRGEAYFQLLVLTVLLVVTLQNFTVEIFNSSLFLLIITFQLSINNQSNAPKILTQTIFTNSIHNDWFLWIYSGATT